MINSDRSKKTTCCLTSIFSSFVALLLSREMLIEAMFGVFTMFMFAFYVSKRRTLSAVLKLSGDDGYGVSKG